MPEPQIYDHPPYEGISYHLRPEEQGQQQEVQQFTWDELHAQVKEAKTSTEVRELLTQFAQVNPELPVPYSSRNVSQLVAEVFEYVDQLTSQDINQQLIKLAEICRYNSNEFVRSLPGEIRVGADRLFNLLYKEISEEEEKRKYEEEFGELNRIKENLLQEVLGAQTVDQLLDLIDHASDVAPEMWFPGTDGRNNLVVVYNLLFRIRRLSKFVPASRRIRFYDQPERIARSRFIDNTRKQLKDIGLQEEVVVKVIQLLDASIEARGLAKNSNPYSSRPNFSKPFQR